MKLASIIGNHHAGRTERMFLLGQVEIVFKFNVHAFTVPAHVARTQVAVTLMESSPMIFLFLLVIFISSFGIAIVQEYIDVGNSIEIDRDILCHLAFHALTLIHQLGYRFHTGAGHALVRLPPPFYFVFVMQWL